MLFTPLAELIDTPLHGVTLTPPDPVASVLIVHGISEHAGRYAATMQFLADRNLACYAYDQRGHGLSPGQRTDIDRFERFQDDLHAIVQGLHATQDNRPLFVWGHSMGAVVATLTAPQFGPAVRGVVTTGCPISAYSTATPWLLPPLRLFTRLAPTARVRSVLSASALTHDASVRHAYVNDPLVVRTATLRLLTQLAGAFANVKTLAPQLRVPWLAAHGEQDAIAPVAGSRTLVSLLGSADKHLMVIAQARHELHNEVDPARQHFLESMTRWVLDRSAVLE